MFRRFVFAVSLMLLAVALISAAPNVAGKWTLKQAAAASTLDLAVDGATLSGTLSERSSDGKFVVQLPLVDGRVDGASVSFSVMREVGARQYTTRYQGTLLNDSQMDVVITLPNLGGEPFKVKASATRQ